jgi:hypothetical protein
MLKGTAHPTYGKAVEADAAMGYRIVQAPDGRYYSVKGRF